MTVTGRKSKTLKNQHCVAQSSRELAGWLKTMIKAID